MQDKAYIPFCERPCCSVDEAAKATSLCRSTIYNRMKEGKLDYRKNGKRRLVLVSSLMEMIGIA